MIIVHKYVTIIHMMQFGKGIYIMNQTKIQDVIRHISKDEDYGVDMMEKLSLADAVEVMAGGLGCCTAIFKEKSQGDGQY